MTFLSEVANLLFHALCLCTHTSSIEKIDFSSYLQGLFATKNMSFYKVYTLL